MEWFRYWRTRYRRWQYMRTPRLAFVPTVTPVERHWTATDEKLERDLYLASPCAFWLRPDRHEHKVPCWQIEGVWEAPPPHPLSNLYAAGLQNSAMGAFQQSQIAHAYYRQSQFTNPNSLYSVGQLLGKPFGY